MSTVTAKIITAAAVVAIGVGAVVTYKHVTKPTEQGFDLSQAGIIVQEQGDEQEKGIEIEEAIKETTEQPRDKPANLLTTDRSL
jgi:hypothetical protein